RKECQSCHKSPKDALHRQITGNCSQCHGQAKWVPATFDHDRHFVLDGDHNVKCATCHVRNDYASYTCYGCHEHTPDNIRREHIEEGIRDFKDCAECHRSADEHDIRMPGRERGTGHGKERDEG
ncbi:MAG TPA: class III cytochrome C family protein, partial [Thiobacillaceae bacterium]|nr:class III cytochrome C family protein [Thiobacillaceae bacterium]